MMSLITSLSGAAHDLLQPQFLINALLKVSLVLASAGLVNTLLKRSSAAVRHWIWSLAFYGLLMMPFLSQAVPGWNLAWLPVIRNSEIKDVVVASSQSQRTSAPEEKASVFQQQNQPGPVAAAESTESPSQLPYTANTRSTDARLTTEASGLWSLPWHFWMFAVWIAGSVLLLGRLVWELASICWLLRTGKANQDRNWKDILRHCQYRLKLQRKVHLIFSDRITIPITFGLFRSVVLLPDSARQWSSQEREVVLIHELEHVRRWDYLSNLAAQIVCAFYWLNPLVWVAEKWQRIEREQACDDTVIGHGAESCAYASYLLDLAKSLPANRRAHCRAIAIAHNSELKKRLGHILSRSIKRTGLPRKVGIVSAIVVVSVLLPLAAVQLEPRNADIEPQRSKSHSAIQSLIAQLQSDHADIQKRAAWSLGERENRQAVEPLIKALRDHNSHVKAMAAWALGEIKDGRALQPLLDAMKDDNAYVREMVVRAVGELESWRAMRPLVNMLADPESKVRAAALWSLGELGDKQSFYAVVEMLNDPNVEVRSATLRALHGIGCDPAFVAVTASLKDTHPAVRQTAAEVLGELTHKPTNKILSDVLYAYSPGGYRSFVRILPMFENRTAVDYLVEALQDPDSGVRASAAETLGKVGNPAAVEALIRSTQDANLQVRAKAVWALDEINIPN